MKLHERGRVNCALKNFSGNIENYETLASFPFTSESKKMGILIKNLNTGTIIYIVKGAEIVVENMIKPAVRPSLMEICETLAMDGLRTLVFAQKVVTQVQAEEFLQKLWKA